MARRAVVEVLLVGKWTVAFSKATNLTVLGFEFEDQPPLRVALPQDQAAEIAAAIQAQLKSPPDPDRMN